MPYKKIAFFAVIVIFILTINNLVSSIYDIWQKQEIITQAQQELDTQKEENSQLKKQIAQVKQPQFIETEARDKLLLAKPGEGIIIIPPNQVAASSSSIPQLVDNRPNWEKWWDTFFKA